MKTSFLFELSANEAINDIKKEQWLPIPDGGSFTVPKKDSTGLDMTEDDKRAHYLKFLKEFENYPNTPIDIRYTIENQYVPLDLGNVVHIKGRRFKIIDKYYSFLNQEITYELMML